MIVIVVGVAVAAAAGGYVVMSGNGGNTPTNGDTTDGTDGTGEAETWSAYEYEEGEYYEYSVDSANTSGTFSWSVESVEGDQVTVAVEWIPTNGEKISAEYTNDKSIVGIQSPVGPYLSSAWITGFQGEDFAVGNNWSVTVEGKTYTSKVTDTETYAGVEGYVGKVSIDDTTVFKAVVSPDLALPIYVASYDEDTGEIDQEIELQNYSS